MRFSYFSRNTESVIFMVSKRDTESSNRKTESLIGYSKMSLEVAFLRTSWGIDLWSIEVFLLSSSVATMRMQ